MKRQLLGLCAALFLLPNPAGAASPERVVKGSRLISKADPAIVIKLPREAKYVGADRWDLYDIADAELHVFVEADRDKNVKTMYWIQFEGYLPSNTHIYNYTKDEAVKFAGRDFWQRARFGPTSGPPRAGSDLEHVRALLAQAGYKTPAETMNVRLVQVLDEARRKELMFIYAEDLAPTGYTSAQLMDGEQTRPEWEPIKQKLLERARKRIRIVD
jgi:hypothetical protein